MQNLSRGRFMFVSFFLSLFFIVSTANAAPNCGKAGKLSIANMTWLSASFHAEVLLRILRDGYGCSAELVPGDTVPTISSVLSKSKPHIVPELWISTVEESWKKIQKKGNASVAGDTFEGGGVEGLFIPDYIYNKYPDLRHVDDLAKYWKLFASKENPKQGRFYGCPPGWGCEITTRNFFKAYALEKANFEYFSPGSGANLKAVIARQVTRKKPVLAYYWGPTDVLGRYNLKKLKMDRFDKSKFSCISDKSCANPQRTDFASAKVVTVMTNKVKDEAPDVAKFLSKATYKVASLNQVLAWADANKASPADAAEHFLKSFDEWRQWVPAEVADKVSR